MRAGGDRARGEPVGRRQRQCGHHLPGHGNQARRHGLRLSRRDRGRNRGLEPNADAVSVTGGAHPGRRDAALRAIRRRVAKHVVVVNIKVPNKPSILTRVGGTETMTVSCVHAAGSTEQANAGQGGELHLPRRRHAERRRDPGGRHLRRARSTSPSTSIDGRLNARRRRCYLAADASALPPPEVIRVSTLQVACDGSGEISPALGHPRVYLRIDDGDRLRRMRLLRPPLCP